MINDLNKLLTRCDLLMRPYALVIAPENKEQILEAMPHLQDKMKIIVCGLVEKDKCYLMERAAIDPDSIIEEIGGRIYGEE